MKRLRSCVNVKADVKFSSPVFAGLNEQKAKYKDASGCNPELTEDTNIPGKNGEGQCCQF